MLGLMYSYGMLKVRKVWLLWKCLVVVTAVIVLGVFGAFIQPRGLVPGHRYPQ